MNAITHIQETDFVRRVNALIGLQFDRALADRWAIAEMLLCKKAPANIADVVARIYKNALRDIGTALPEAKRLARLPNAPTALELAAHPGTFVRELARAALRAGPKANAETVFAVARLQHHSKMNRVRVACGRQPLTPADDTCLPVGAKGRLRLVKS